MNIMKFGGSSLASPSRIKLVSETIQEKLQEDTSLVVFSAFGGVTNDFLQMADLAATGDLSYKKILQKNEKRHLDAIKELIPIKNQSAILSKVKTEFNGLETLYEGVYLLNELSNKTKHVIASYGEILSSLIITEYFKALNINVKFVDSRDLIVCKNENEKVQVNYVKTNTNINK
jgi:aspartokinase/homoserine dehydrogenase 1